MSGTVLPLVLVALTVAAALWHGRRRRGRAAGDGLNGGDDADWLGGHGHSGDFGSGAGDGGGGSDGGGDGGGGGD